MSLFSRAKQLVRPEAPKAIGREVVSTACLPWTAFPFGHVVVGRVEGTYVYKQTRYGDWQFATIRHADGTRTEMSYAADLKQVFASLGSEIRVKFVGTRTWKDKKKRTEGTKHLFNADILKENK